MNPCLACGGTSGRVLEHQFPVHPNYGGDFELQECLDCGTASTSPPPSPATLSRLYRDEYNYEWFKDAYWAKLLDARSRVRALKPHLGARVIDYGGGVGYLARAARREGHTARTYDPFAEPGTPSAVLPPEQYDSAILVHVVEHSPDPAQLLAEVGSLIVGGGTVVVNVPNYRSIGFSRRGWAWTWAQAPLVHISHFTEEGLRKLGHRTGYDVEDVSYWERWDGNSLSDVTAQAFFRKFESLRNHPALRSRARLRRATFLAGATLRFIASALSHRLTREPTRRSELQVVLRKPA